MNIETIIEKYEGNILNEEEFEELCFEECVERIEWNGWCGMYPGLRWYTIYFIDGQDIDVFTE
jgi:hypothetical protein